MICIVEYLFCHSKGSFKGITLVVNQLADKLGDRDNRVSIVELYGDIVCKVIESAEASLVLSDNICKRSTAEEILLFKAELFAF